jgi:hypothetical protein
MLHGTDSSSKDMVSADSGTQKSSAKKKYGTDTGKVSFENSTSAIEISIAAKEVVDTVLLKCLIAEFVSDAVETAIDSVADLSEDEGESR